MRAARHITAAALAALMLAGCAAQHRMEGYVGRPVGAAFLDYGSPDEVFRLSDGSRAYQWEIEEEGFRPTPRPTIGVGIGVGSGHWGGGITTVNTSYVPYSRTCRYTLIANQRGDDWIVSDFRQPVRGCS